MGRRRAKTPGRTPGETPETPEEILAAAKAAQKPYDMLAFARVAKQTAAALRSERFELNRAKSTVDQRPIHYFRVRGESITGTLGKPNLEMWGTSSYPLVLDDGTVVRIPGNRDLQRKLNRLNCVHQRITIEYLGKRNLTTAHYEKIYAIHPAPLAAESIADTKAGRTALRQVAEKAGVKPPAEKPKRPAKQTRAEDPKDVRRKFVQGMIDKGHKPAQRSLKEFAGEAWADKWLQEAK